MQFCKLKCIQTCFEKTRIMTLPLCPVQCLAQHIPHTFTGLHANLICTIVDWVSVNLSTLTSWLIAFLSGLGDLGLSELSINSWQEKDKEEQYFVTVLNILCTVLHVFLTIFPCYFFHCYEEWNWGSTAFFKLDLCSSSGFTLPLKILRGTTHNLIPVPEKT